MFIIGTGSVLRAGPAEVAVQRQAATPRPRPWRPPCETPRIALAPSLALLGVPSSSIMSWSIASWSRGSRPISSGAILVLTFSTALVTPLPSVLLLVVVAQLDGFVLAGAGARRDGGAAEGAVFEDDVDFDGRVAAGVEDLPALDEFDVDAHQLFAPPHPAGETHARERGMRGSPVNGGSPRPRSVRGRTSAGGGTLLCYRTMRVETCNPAGLPSDAGERGESAVPYRIPRPSAEAVYAPLRGCQTAAVSHRT